MGMVQGYASREFLENAIRAGMGYQDVQVLRILLSASISAKTDSGVPALRRRIHFS